MNRGRKSRHQHRRERSNYGAETEILRAQMEAINALSSVLQSHARIKEELNQVHKGMLRLLVPLYRLRNDVVDEALESIADVVHDSADRIRDRLDELSKYEEDYEKGEQEVDKDHAGTGRKPHKSKLRK
jgi:prefoldin subunit 5